MTVMVRATVTCTAIGCRKWVSLVGRSGVNVTRVLYIAANEYGWTTGKGSERCFEHRNVDIKFHPWKEWTTDHGARCTCGSYWKNDPQHREAEIRANAHDLTEDGEATITWVR